MSEVNDNSKTCPFCGAPVDSGADFCPSCMENLPITVPKAASGQAAGAVPAPDVFESEEERKRKAFANMRKKLGAWCVVGMAIAGLGMILHRFFENPLLTYGLIFLGLILVFIGGGYGLANGSPFCPHCGRQPRPRLMFDPYCPHCRKRMW